jgi:microcystin-dependent protein
MRSRHCATSIVTGCGIVALIVVLFAQQNEAANFAQLGGEAYIGQILIVPYDYEPRGWANCDGQLLRIAEHNALFSLLGTTYGGDGRTTFALPDLRGRSPVHEGEGPGLTKVSRGQKGGGVNVDTDADSVVTTQPFLGVRYIISLNGIYPSRN